MKRAFTLIELLVVIAIIAILAAILFPVFAQAKDAAKKSVSLSNTKQINLGLVLYTNDSDDVYPSSVTERISPNYGTSQTQADAAIYSIRAKLNPYIKSDALFKDPSSVAWPTPGPKAWYSTDYGFNFNDKYFVGNPGVPYAPAFAITSGAVSVNGHTVQALGDFGFNQDVSQTALASPASFITVGEGAQVTGLVSRGGLYPQPWAFDDSAGVTNADGTIASGITTQSRLWPRHGRKTSAQTSGNPAGFSGTWLKVEGGVNIGYADGHSKWVTDINKTWRTYNDNDWRRNPSTP